jgi:hypothetical protein
MTDCLTSDAEGPPLDPCQRVHYNFGMVLGVNDFRQEQEHFEWKHALGNALLHGFGTVSGLAVSTAPDSGGADVRVSVAPGLAVSPKGRWIRVASLQCGLLGEWLAGRSEFSGPGPAQAYVTLCYRECQTELVPVASGACASEDDTRKPSRTLETFRLEFAPTAPQQAEEQAARRLGALLRRIRVVPAGSPAQDDRELLLALVSELGTPASPPASALGSPPGEYPLHLTETDAAEVMQRVLLRWVTEVCPQLRSQVEAAAEDSLLLALLSFELDTGGALRPETLRIDERERPILVKTRVQQELLGLVGRTPGL